MKILQLAAFVLIFWWWQPGCTNTSHKAVVLLVPSNSSWTHQYLPRAGSIIWAHIIAANWVVHLHILARAAGSIIGTQSIEKAPIHSNIITSTLHTASNSNIYTHSSCNISTYSTRYKSKSNNNAKICTKQWQRSDRNSNIYK